MSSNHLWINADKTQFVWLGTRQQPAKICRSSDGINSSWIWSYLSRSNIWQRTDLLEAREISCSAMFLHLQQLRIVRDAKPLMQSRCLFRPLSQASWTIATAFSTWSLLLARKLSSPSLMQWLASSWENGNTTVLLQPYVTTSIGCRSRSVYRTSRAPWCTSACIWPLLTEMCVPVTASTGCQCLHSASHDDLTVPHTRMSKYAPHSFVVSGLSTCNSLPPAICQLTTLRQFQKQLKTFLFCSVYRTWLGL